MPRLPPSATSAAWPIVAGEGDQRPTLPWHLAPVRAASLCPWCSSPATTSSSTGRPLPTAYEGPSAGPCLGKEKSWRSLPFRRVLSRARGVCFLPARPRSAPLGPGTLEPECFLSHWTEAAVGTLLSDRPCFSLPVTAGRARPCPQAESRWDPPWPEPGAASPQSGCRAGRGGRSLSWSRANTGGDLGPALLDVFRNTAPADALHSFKTKTTLISHGMGGWGGRVVGRARAGTLLSPGPVRFSLWL